MRSILRFAPIAVAWMALSWMPMAVHAATVFTTSLSGPNESPPNASPGTGFATVTWDEIAHTMRVQVNFAGLLAPVTASHIHVTNGPGDANPADTLGPVATTTPSFTGFPGGVTSGAYDHLFDMTNAASYNATFVTAAGSVALAETALYAALVDGRSYLNIHTQQYAGGEIRGFLAAAVPEPGTLVLLGLGLAGLGIARSRRPR